MNPVIDSAENHQTQFRFLVPPISFRIPTALMLPSHASITGKCLGRPTSAWQEERAWPCVVTARVSGQHIRTRSGACRCYESSISSTPRPRRPSITSHGWASASSTCPSVWSRWWTPVGSGSKVSMAQSHALRCRAPHSRSVLPFAACYGLSVHETGRDSAFCGHAIMPDAPDIFEVCNAASDPRFSNNPLVIAHPHIRYVARAPTRANGPVPLGHMCAANLCSNALPRVLVLLSAWPLVTLFGCARLCAQVLCWRASPRLH